MSHKILLIDDDIDDRIFFYDAVSRVSSDISCKTLESGIALLSDLKSKVLDRPDLIFIDLNMPEISGWVCLSMLKKSDEFAEIPVIMYSTSNHIEEAIKAKKNGAVAFFSKPYDFKELIRTLKEVIDHLERDTLSQLAQNSDRFY
jgi:DNA-binding NtrC family response regulator